MSDVLAALGKAREILTVGELTRRVKGTLEVSFGSVWLTGEVSNLRAPASGHVYLTLKDADAQVKAVVWGATARYLKFRPKDGDQVLCRGRLTVYEPRGDYQVIIDYLEAAGTGALFRQFEQVKAKLLAEGLFDKENKRPLAAFPRRVAVVTSDTGAAVRDILNVLGRRAPGLPVLVVPVRVQGEGAAAELATALGRAAAADDIDLVILTRGGGSQEDLAAFNDEALARAVAACPVPVVSGVGHETDTTIVDFAADLRAPTPSAAAELVSTAWVEVRARIGDAQARAARALRQLLGTRTLQLQRVRAGLVDPRERLRHLIQRVDDLGRHLEGAARRHLDREKGRHHAFGLRLLGTSPAARIPPLKERCGALGSRLSRAMQWQLERSHGQVAGVAGKLQELSPLGVLERGYAIARSGEDILRRADQVAVGDPVDVRLHQDTLRCRVEAITRDRGTGKMR